MKVPLRALSWVTRFFWIIALAFAITCAYSATLIRVNFGQPITSFSEDSFTVTLPVVFGNKGYYNIDNLNITTQIVDNENRQISKSTSYLARIPPKNNATVYHNVSMTPTDIMAHAEYLFEDSNFTLHGSVQLDYANLIPFELRANMTIPWGAPFYNFTADMPRFSLFNITHLQVDVPISFQNHSPYFSVEGTIRIFVYNSTGRQVGETEAAVDVPQSTFYDGQIEMLIDPSIMSGSGQVHIYVETDIFSFGPEVIDYGYPTVISPWV